MLEEGPSDGPEAGDGDIVSVYYVGVLSEDGTEFDSNYGSGTPLASRSAPAIGSPAGTKACTEREPGDRLQLDIPSDLAYGETGSQDGGIPPDTALTFVMDVVDVVDLPELALPEEAPTELGVTVLSEGPGEGPEVVPVRHRQRLLARGVLSADGTQFENSFASGTPTPVIVGGGPVAGLGEGLIGARVGDQLQIDVPADQAYGETGNAEIGIPPAAALSYAVEIVEIDSPPEFELPDEAPEEAVRTVLEEGEAEGRVAQRFDTVTVDILGALIDDGFVFASTFGTGQPIPLTVGQPSVIDGPRRRHRRCSPG